MIDNWLKNINEDVTTTLIYIELKGHLISIKINVWNTSIVLKYLETLI